MMSLNARFKSAILVIAMLTVNHVGAFSTNIFTPTSKKIGVLLAIGMWIRVRTKGSNYDYKLSDWRDDLKEIMEEYNIFDIELYKKLLELFDKYAIGRQVSILDVTYRSKREDGTIMTLKDKKLKCSPFGLMGLFDSYVIMQIEKIGETYKNWKDVKEFFTLFDDKAETTKDNIKVDVVVKVEK